MLASTRCCVGVGIGEQGSKDLLTMSKLLIIAMAAAAALFIGLSATMNALFLSSLGRTALETVILAALSIASDITKATLPVVIMRSAVIRAWLHVTGASLLLLLVTILSLSSGTEFAALTTGSAVAARQADADHRSAVDAALRDVQARLALVTRTRPLSVIEADIAVAIIDRRWSVSKSCSEINGQPVRQFCSDLLKLRSERAAAIEHDRIAVERDAAQARLSVLTSKGSGAETDPQAVAIATLLGIEPAMPRRVLTIFIAVVVELGSVILVLLAAGPALLGWREPGSEPAPSPVPVDLPRSRDVSHWHRHRGASKFSLNPGGTDAP